MKEEVEAAETVSDLIARTPIGQPVRVEFSGNPTPIVVTFKFTGGWIVEQKLSPGMPLEFIRGEDKYLENIRIDILSYEGLK
ncbi:hypothetical protein [Pseudomonas sp. D1HM]|uniref:hypothetical protein n=1 Tax=Pseudomonas sp. D1HM TaxID=1784816 RepID=UPI001C4F6DDE|nr:hypothetical protein [Pseudomonas sp. D1HM]MBW0236351.1 hypothetical protein [Pseudomonas sp. D1HM]